MHFSKVGDQTIAQLHAFVRAAREHELATVMIERLAQQLENARTGSPTPLLAHGSLTEG